MCAVEWKPLKEIVESISTGLNPRQNFVLNEDYASLYYVTVKEISSNKIVFSENTDKISKEAKNIINKRSKLEIGDILFSGIGTIGKVVYVDIPTSNWDCSESVFILKPSDKVVSGKYLTYILLSDIAKKQYEIGANGSIMKGVRKNTLENILIPIPSLAKQQEIVSHLDTFTTLISNLESELDMRRKQYEHYRNQLLDFEGVDGIEWKTLGEIGEFVRGNGIQKKDFVEDGYGCIHYGQVYTQFGLLAYETIANIEKALYDKCRIAKCGDIVLATTSENLEDVAKPVIWLGDEDIAVSGDAFIYKHNQNPIFIGSQFLTDRFSKFKGMNAKGAKVIRITGDSMAEYKIALPSLEKQNEIAEGIKSFENIIQSLEQEIKLRKQQYEYYREKLLTFE